MPANADSPIVREIDIDASPDVVFEFGTFLEVEPTRVVFTWGFADSGINVRPGSSVVEVTLHPVGPGTRVQLVHRDLPAADIHGHAGWTTMLDRLADAVTTARAEER